MGSVMLVKLYYFVKNSWFKFVVLLVFSLFVFGVMIS